MKRIARLGVLLGAFVVSPTGGLAATAPPNDSLAGATAVTAIPFYKVVNNSRATSQPQDLSCNPPEGHSIWFTVKPPAGTYLARAPSPDPPVNSDVIVASGSMNSLHMVSCGLYGTQWQADGTTVYHIEMAEALGSPGGEVDFSIDPYPLLVKVTVNPIGHVRTDGSAVITGRLDCNFPLISAPHNGVVVAIIHQNHHLFAGQVAGLTTCIGTTATAWRIRVDGLDTNHRTHPGDVRVEVDGDVGDHAQFGDFDVFRHVTLRR